MLYCNFKNAIVCDVIQNEFEGKVYHKALIYSDRTLIPVSIPSGAIQDFSKAVAKKVNFAAQCNNYDGKAKYKFADDSVLQVVGG